MRSFIYAILGSIPDKPPAEQVTDHVDTGQQNKRPRAKVGTQRHRGDVFSNEDSSGIWHRCDPPSQGLLTGWHHIVHADRGELRHHAIDENPALPPEASISVTVGY